MIDSSADLSQNYLVGMALDVLTLTFTKYIFSYILGCALHVYKYDVSEKNNRTNMVNCQVRKDFDHARVSFGA